MHATIRVNMDSEEFDHAGSELARILRTIALVVQNDSLDDGDYEYEVKGRYGERVAKLHVCTDE